MSIRHNRAKTTSQFKPRLVLLTAIVAACLLVPVAGASAVPVTVTLAGAGQGTVTSSSPAGIECSNVGGGAPGPTCSTDLTDFEDFTALLTATPAEGYVFVGWTLNSGFGVSGCTTPAGSPPTCSPFLFEPIEVTATFVPPPERALVTTGETAAGSTPSLVTLKGQVNPNGSESNDCHFMYGTTSAYGQSTTCDQSTASIGGGTENVAVTASTEPLDPNTTYHYRLSVSNVGGTSQGKDRTFTTAPAPSDNCPNAAIRAEQGIKALGLPDCMALEMVSPSQKGQQFARFPSVSVDDKRVLFQSTAWLAEAPSHLSAFGDDYVATRGASGWQTASTTPRPPVTFGYVQAESFTPDFSRWFNIGSTADQEPHGEVQAFENGVSGVFSPISPLLSPMNGEGGALLKGASADHSHLYIASPGQGEGKKSTSFLPGDPQPEGQGADNNVYVAKLGSGGQPTVELLARDLNGKAWGGNCGSRLGGMEKLTGTGLSLPNGERNQGAISADGSLVYFSTRPGQPSTGNCSETNKERIMKRVETPAGPVISELFQSECTRVSPPCSTTNGDDLYQGASVDQTKVYFTTTRQLTNSDRDGGSESCIGDYPPEGFHPVAGCDLYLYDSTKPAGERLTQVSAGDATDPTPGEGADVLNGIAAISADGSHVYFAAAGVLTTTPNPSGATAIAGRPNFYSWDEATGKTSFIGTLATGPSLFENDGAFIGSGLWGDEGTWRDGPYPVPIMGTDAHGNQVGGDGHIFLFRSRASLTPNDTDGGHMDVYRYDSTAQPSKLECVTCRPGGPDSEPIDVEVDGSGGIGTDYAEQGRWVSEDGNTVVFSTAESLLPGDVNGVQDSYMWRNGQLFRLPGTAKLGLEASATTFPTVSPDGSTVAFTSGLQLLPSDGDSIQDVYVARVDGGFTAPAPAPDCEGESCQGAPSAPLGEVGAASSLFSGRGNAAPVSSAGSKPVATKALTRAQRLANALKACRKKPKKRRAVCERRARKQYAAKATSKRQSIKSKTTKASGKGSK